jgi:2-amino-4-hydroxy-6-hydroxymethyldihydropteridine diphosphokinase/dihydropteroate synthase
MFPASSTARFVSDRQLERIVTFACRAAKRRRLCNGLPLLPIREGIQRKSNQPFSTNTKHSNSSRQPALGSFCQPSRLRDQATTMRHRAFVALGSNLGDRVGMIETACREMDQSGKIRVLRTSSLWETKAMYVLDQDKFVNGVCEVRTTWYSPRDGCSYSVGRNIPVAH